MKRRMARVVGGQCDERTEARVWNEVSRMSVIVWNDCLLQRSDWRLMITLGWREGRNGLGIKHQIGMEVEWKEWNGV